MGPYNSFFTDSAPGYKAKQIKPATSLPEKKTVSVGDPGEPHNMEQLLSARCHTSARHVADLQRREDWDPGSVPFTATPCGILG